MKIKTLNKNPLAPTIPRWLNEIRDDIWLLAACWILCEQPSIVAYRHSNGVINKYNIVNKYIDSRIKANKYFSVPYLAELYIDSQIYI